MGVTERYLSQIGTLTGDEMKCALYQLLVPRYFWTLWNSESSQKLASSVVNYLFCESASGDLAVFMAEQRGLLESKARELTRDDALCQTLTCAIYNFSYGRYIDSGGKVGLLFPPFIGFIRAIQEVASGRKPANFLNSFIEKVGTSSEPLLRLFAFGLYRPLPSTPDSKLMREEVAKFIHKTQTERLSSFDALEVVEVSGYIAAALVAFSGSRHVTTADTGQFAFEDPVAMLGAGFEPKEDILTRSLVPIASEFVTDELFPAAFRSAIAFICYYVYVVIRRKIKDPDNRYSNQLQSCVAKLCAGKFGFSSEPATVFDTIQRLIPRFFEKPWINSTCAASDDCLGKILSDLSVEVGNSNRYGFVVGSQKQPIGCAAPFLQALMRLTDVFSRVQEKSPVGVA